MLLSVMAALQQQPVIRLPQSKITPLEYDSWKAFTTHSINLPRVDWDADRETLPISAKPLRIACRHAEALRRLYATDRAQPCHSVWFTTQFSIIASKSHSLRKFLNETRSM